MKRFTSSHWGVYEILGTQRDAQLGPFDRDPDPSPIGLSMLDASKRLRVEQPCVRRSWLEHGVGSHPELRGIDPFVQVSWDDALDLAADALRGVIDEFGNQAIFGGSYGWSSAGRFHHAQSQIHRFLNAAGGFVRHLDSYSIGAARVLMPHIVAPMDDLMAQHTSWDVMRDNTTLFVAFGGVPAKNAQVNPGGASEHLVSGGLAQMANAGVEFINISPMRANLETGKPFRWIKIRPNTDTAMMLGLAHTIRAAGRHNTAFLEKYCVGFEQFEAYLTGQTDGQPKDARWASRICGVASDVIEALALKMVSARTMINVSWAVQRAHHGEQPYWMLVTLASMLGQIGLPGGGFGVGYGAMNMMGMANPKFGGPTLSQGQTRVQAFIPVARLTDMLEKPGQTFDYNGSSHQYPDIRLIYWAGGNPFHHHQDLRRLIRAWRKVPHVLVNEQFWTPNARLADIVLPATTTLEREDIGFSTIDRYIVAMRKVIDPVGQSRDDYDIFRELARRLGCEQVFTEGRDAGQWIRHLYDDCQARAKAAGVALPAFDDFWEQGLVDIARPGQRNIMLEDFRHDPERYPLPTPSGKIELYSKRIAGFDYDDCPGHAVWLEPAEWLGGDIAKRWPLHLISDQPVAKLHSQLDHSDLSRASKLNGREKLEISPVDAQRRNLQTGDVVWITNDRGRCLASAVITEDLAPGVVKLSTGAWFDPDDWSAIEFDKHGNPNILTLDIGSSKLSQGCSAHTCLVDVSPHQGPAPAVTAYEPPVILEREG